MTFVTVEGCGNVGDNQKRARERLRLLRKLSLVLLWLAACTAVPAAHAKDLAVISNKSNGLQTIALADLVKVCRGEMRNWPDGRPVTFIMLDPHASEMKLVLQKVYDAKAEDVKELIESANHGRMNHPAIVVAKSDEDVVTRVQSIPGAVGVVDVYSITGGVVVVKVAGKNPFEPGYLLHGN